MLRLNTAKTEVMWCTSTRRQHQLPDGPMLIGSDAVSPTHCLRSLGIYVDSALTMTSHVAKTVSGCFAALRQIRSIRRSVTRPCPAVIGRVACTVAARLRTVYVGRSTRSTAQPPPISPQCGRPSCLFGTQVRPHHAAAEGTALAAHSTANPVSPGVADLSLSARSGAAVSG